MDEKAQTPVIGSIMLLILAVLAWLLIGRVWKSDVAFCREVFEGLVNGNPSVASHIDWAHLQATGVNVGATYASLPASQDQWRYERTFIQKFAEGFRQAGGQLAAFRHWRVHAREDDRVVIAADDETKQKTLLLTVSATRPKKLEAMQWQ